MTILTTDHAVPHTSTEPANTGQSVNLFVRELVDTDAEEPEVVLMLHGRTVSGLPTFDLQYGDYSWARDLADAGYDVFIMDLQGAGKSPRPKMDDPCNISPSQQQQLQSILVPNPLENGPCSPSYPHQLGNSQSNWDEVDTVVDYIIGLRRQRHVALIGHSAAAFAFGPYALQHPEKVASLFLTAPIFPPRGRKGTGDGFGVPAGVTLPVSSPAGTYGFPTNVFVKEGFPSGEVPLDVVWKAMMESDDLGSTWGPTDPATGLPEGVSRWRFPYWWGWNSTTAPLHGTLGRRVPVFIVYGDLDTTANTPESSPDVLYFSVPALYAAIPGPRKLMIRVAGTGHQMNWEGQYKVLHGMSRQWLKDRTVDGFEEGSYFLDGNGVYHPATEP
ncbi:alpha/beta fold hydrolase [Streptomyces sp. NPDC059916]|uniref:alpha/beta fold hydrolase n=1 Tax=Streptomyces sp. NPDC059916 TaxID=3347001 RepID=UPI0036925C74